MVPKGITRPCPRGGCSGIYLDSFCPDPVTEREGQPFSARIGGQDLAIQRNVAVEPRARAAELTERSPGVLHDVIGRCNAFREFFDATSACVVDVGFAH